MNSIDYDISKIEWHKAGDGTPLLLLHGWGANLNTMQHLFDKLKPHRTVYSLSMPGFGRSPEPAQSIGSRDFAQIIHDWCRVNIGMPFDLMGHSHGGRVGICLAADYAAAVNKMILIDSAGIPPRKSMHKQLKVLQYKSLKRLHSLMPKVIAFGLSQRMSMMGSADWKSASPTMRRILSRVVKEDLSEQMVQIKSKTLLIWGTEDQDTPVWMGEKMSDLIVGSKLVKIPGAGHYSFLDSPGEVVSSIWQFLDLPNAW